MQDNANFNKIPAAVVEGTGWLMKIERKSERNYTSPLALAPNPSHQPDGPMGKSRRMDLTRMELNLPNMV